MRGGVVKKGILFLLVFAVAGAAFGDLSKYKDWAKSPEAYFLTPPEREEWGKLKTDDEAEKFIAAYWAKRGGDVFKQEISRRIEAADQQFKMRRYERGALSARGRLLVALGPPSKQVRERTEETPGNPLGSGDSRADITGGTANLFLTWIYEKDRFPADWGIGEVRAKILVDQVRGIDELQTGSTVERAIAKVAEKSIGAASSTAAAPAASSAAAPPAVAAAPPAAAAARPAAPAAAPPPPAPAAASLPASVRSILQAGMTVKAPEGSFWGGPFRTLSGDPFYAFELSLPAEKAAAGVKFGGLVTTDTGEEKASFWEDATLVESKTGAATSKVFVRSVALPPGSYRGAFGLFSADGSAALVSAGPEFKLEPKSGDFEVSPLLVTNLLTPFGKRAQPTEPFIFGKPEKPIQIVPKANRLFTNQDGLWYFYTVRNPAKPAETSSSTKASEDKPPATPAAPGAAAAPAAEAPRPRVMATISVLRNGKQAFQPATGPAELEPFGEGVYGEGKEIPLAKFEPGYYTFIVSVRDLNAPRDSAASKGTERRSDFVVLKPDGSMPDKPAPTPAAKAPAKKG
jgi:GWxTD domain-containing protein